MWYLIGMYLAAIVAANLTIAVFGPSMAIVNAFVFIALDLTSRDWLHEAWHHNGLLWKMTALIAAGSLISYVLNASAGPVALASFVAFAAAALADTLIYIALGDRSYLVKANGSNVVSAAVDSVVFGSMRGFPILIIVGQFAAKVIGGALWAYLLRPKRRTA